MESAESFIVDESYLSLDEFFSITLRQDSPVLGHVTEVKEGHPRNSLYMREKSHVLVEDNSQVPHSRTGRQCIAIQKENAVR